MLYLFVRSDMASMTPGNVAKTVAHMTIDFMVGIQNLYDIRNNVIGNHLFSDRIEQLHAQFLSWRNHKRVEIYNYSTLQSDMDTLQQRIKIENIFGTVYYDDQYVIQDGNVRHKVSIETGQYIFGEPTLVGKLLGPFTYYR